MVALRQRSSASSGPRELFSISQIERAYGPAYSAPGTEGCVRAWGEAYLTGLREAELSYEEALALPETTALEKREKSSYIAKTFGKALEARADEWFETGTARFDDEPGKRLFPGLHLLPHPTQLDPGGYQKQVPVSVKLFSSASPEALSFQGFKDAIFKVNGSKFLIDYKTTRPVVDNRKNAELGKPAGTWTWSKTQEQLLKDYQFNLYEWDHYCKAETFLPARWVYFASRDVPQARAVDVKLDQIDPDRVRSVCTQLADRANVLRGYIRGWRASTDRAAFTASLPKNVTSCNAFGRLCSYHKRSPGGTCAGGDDQVIPVGQLLTSPNARPIKPVTIPVFEPGAFQFSHAVHTGAETDMSIRDQINQQLAQQQAQQPQAPAGFAPAQGYGPPPAPAFVPQGQAPQGAMPFAAPAPQAFAPAPGQPGFAPQAQPTPHVGPPEYQNAQAFANAQTLTAPPVQAPAPAPIKPQAPQGFGAQQGNPDYWADGNGGWLDRSNMIAACTYYGLNVGAYQGFTLAQDVQTSPFPEVAQASAQLAPGAPPEQALHDASEAEEQNDLATLGALFLTLVQAALAHGQSPGASAGEAPKKSRGRPKKSA